MAKTIRSFLAAESVSQNHRDQVAEIVVMKNLSIDADLVALVQDTDVAVRYVLVRAINHYNGEV